MTIYFISDLHLDEHNQASTKLFFKFLDTCANNAKAIYILGDFFDTWVGDDYSTPFIWSIKNALADLDKKNIAIFFMRGNHDFLLGQQFFKETSCGSIPDPYLIEVNGEKILLTHGDLLTTADKEYGLFRKFVQNPMTKFLFRRLPQRIRIAIAQYLKNNSGHAQQRKLQKNPKVFDISQEAVKNCIKKHQVTAIIHGHIHRPGRYEFVLADKCYQRFVLGDWGSAAKILAYEDGKFELRKIFIHG